MIEPQETDLARESEAQRNGLAAEVYEIIKKKILDVETVAGVRLNIDQLARGHGVSSSPVREALARLLSERLVVFKRFAGYVVAELPDKQYFADLIEYRLLLECHAVRLGAPRRDRDTLKRMHDAAWEMERLPLGRTYEEFHEFNLWDARFHMAMIHSAGNRVFVQSYEDLRPHLQLSRLYLRQRRQVEKEAVVKDHLAIINAFEAGDVEASVEAARAHVEHTRKMLEYDTGNEYRRTAAVEEAAPSSAQSCSGSDGAQSARR